MLLNEVGFVGGWVYMSASGVQGIVAYPIPPTFVLARSNLCSDYSIMSASRVPAMLFAGA